MGITVIAWGANHALVGRHVRAASRDGEFVLRGHLRWYVDPTTLVIELAKVEDTSPASLFGGLSDAAASLLDAHRSFRRVELASGTTTVFLLDEDGFRWIGDRSLSGFGLMSGIATRLRTPNGIAAFEENQSTNGFWGRAPNDVRDARTAARAWVQGEFPPAQEAGRD